MLKPEQIRAARALLHWSGKELAEHAQISTDTVRRMENTEGVPVALGTTIDAVARALERGGVEFLDSGSFLEAGGVGVRLRDGQKTSSPNGTLRELTGEQMRAARALLGWSAEELAARANVTRTTIQRMETLKDARVTLGRRLAVQRTMEASGVEFLPAGAPLLGGGVGVRLRRS